MKSIARAMLALAVPCLLLGQASQVDNPINPFSALPGQINTRIVGPLNAAIGGKAGLSGNTFSGYHDFSGASMRLPETVASGLPTASTVTGRIYIVTDASSTGSCIGGGTARAICRSNGSIYEALGGSASGGGSWGTIGGSITAQADLMALINAKQNALTTGTASQYLAGDLTLKPFPAIPTISGSTLLKGTGGNAIAASAADVSALFSGTGNCLYADGTRGDCSGGAGGGSPAGSVGAIQTNAGGGAFGAAVAGTDYVVPSDSRLTNARTPTAHASTHATGGTDVVTPAAIGAVANTDSRLSDARVPVSHATAHKNGGGDEVATATPAANAIPKADASGLLAASWIPDLSGAYVAVAAKGAANGVASLGAGAQIPIAQIPTGTTSSTVAAGNDSRLSDARTPTAHAASHKNGGADEVATATPAANAIPKAGIGGTLAAGWFPTLNQNTTGNAATASALAANGTNCPAGQAAAGVDASGAAEGCFAPTASAAGTGTELQYRNGTSIGAVTGSSVSGNNVTIGGTLTAGGFATAYTGTAQVLELKQGTAPSAPSANSFQLGAPTSIPVAYGWKVPSADGAGLVASDGAGQLSIKGIQGTDTKVLSSGTISGTGATLCTDANGGATTSGCTSGGASTFDQLGSGTNTTATMTVSTGASIVPNGTGIVKATHLTDRLNTITASYTVAATDAFIRCDAASSPIVITLPAATGTGRELQFTKIDSSANNCNITRAGTDTINGATTIGIASQYASTKIIDSAAGSWTNVRVLSGDVTGTAANNNVVKVNGTSVPTNSAADRILGTTASATGAWIAVPQCLDTAGQHLNYDQSTHTLVCGTSGGSGATAPASLGWLPWGYASYSSSPGATVVTNANRGHSQIMFVQGTLASTHVKFSLGAASGTCGGTCGAQIGIYASDLASLVCLSTVGTSGNGSAPLNINTTGVKAFTWASGSAVSGGVCTLTPGTYYMVMTTDSTSLGIANYGDTTSLRILSDDGNGGTGQFARWGDSNTAVSTGSGASIALNSNISAIVFGQATYALQFALHK